MGDLNFRCVLPATSALEHLAAGELTPLIEADELSRAMSTGEVLHGFREAGVLGFLPSFRRTFGAAGALTATELAAERDGTRLAAGRGPSVPRLHELYTVRAKDGTERTPSYTDRVLLHSLPDLANELVCHTYSSCEALAVSDHRPVFADLSLRVHRHAAVRTYAGAAECELTLGSLSLHSAGGAGETPTPASRASLCAHPTKPASAAPSTAPPASSNAIDVERAAEAASLSAEISQDDPTSAEAGERLRTKVKTVQVTLPLPAEDTGAALSAIANVLGGGGTSATGSAPPSSSTKVAWRTAGSPNCLTTTISQEALTGASIARGAIEARPLPLRVSTPFAICALAVHAIVTLADANGKCLGEGVLAVHAPWESRPAAGSEEVGRPGAMITPASVLRDKAAFETALTVQGRLVGVLRGEASAVWTRRG